MAFWVMIPICKYQDERTVGKYTSVILIIAEQINAHSASHVMGDPDGGLIFPKKGRTIIHRIMS